MSDPDINVYRAVERLCRDLDISMIGLVGVQHVDAELNVTATTIPIAGRP